MIDGQTVATKPFVQKLTRRDWGIILALAAINFLHILDFVIIMPLGDRLMLELHLNPAEFSVIVSAYAVSAMIATLAASLVVDRFDRRTTLLACFTGFGISTLFCGLAPNYELLLVARGFAGIFGGLSAAAMLAIIGDRFHDSRRGTATGAVMSAFAVASIIGLPAGLWLANEFGRGMPFIAIAILCIPVGFAAATLLPSMNEHTHGERRSLICDLKQVVSTPRHLVSFAFMFSLIMGTFTIIPFLAPYIVRNAGRTPDDIPLIYLVAGIATFFMLNLVGRLADLFGKRMVFRIMAVLALIMTLTITHLPVVSLFIAIVASTLFMIGASGRMVPAQAMMLASATPSVRGAFVNINSAVQHLAMSVAPLIAGQLMGGGESGPLTGYTNVGYVAAGFSIVSLLLAQFVSPAIESLSSELASNQKLELAAV